MRTLHLFAVLSLSFSPVVSWPQPGTPSSPQSPSNATEYPKATEYRLEAITTQNAVYPPEAREKKIEGEAVVTFLVSDNGEVSHVQVLRADPTLVHAVEDAVSKWKFKPATKDGKAIPVVGRATFKFVLADEAQRTNGVPGEMTGGTEVPRKVRVSSGVSQGLLLKKVNPVYPDEARRDGIQGVVLLRATIDREGSVADLQPISGPPELVPAAIDAVRQWRYRPYLLMGQPLEVETQIQVNFQLRPF